MNSIGENCNDLKREYDSCFNSWFAEKFLRGHTNDSVCAPLFKVYQHCVKEAMKDQRIEFKEIETEHLGSEKEHKIPNSSGSSSSNKSSSDKSKVSSSKSGISAS